MKRWWNRLKIEWAATPLDRKVELLLILGGMMIAGVVLVNNGRQLEQMTAQTEAMKGQLAEMKGGSADTKAIAESAKAQSDSTKALATAAIEQVKQLAAGVQETKRLATATAEALDVAKDTEKRQLRAYLVFGDMNVKHFGVGNKPIIKGFIENMGQTPAHDAGWISGINVNSLTAPTPSTWPDCDTITKSPHHPKWPIAKKAPVFKERQAAFTADEVQRIHNGDAAIYLVGRLCYRDIFEDSHFTDFCMYWKWEEGNLGVGVHCPKSEHAT